MNDGIRNEFVRGTRKSELATGIPLRVLVGRGFEWKKGSNQDSCKVKNRKALATRDKKGSLN